MGTTGDAPRDTGKTTAPAGEWPRFIENLGRLAGGSAVDGPYGLLAVEQERLAAARDHTTAEGP
jgi:hypothetical protein